MYEDGTELARQFGAAALGDARRSRRAEQLAQSLLRRPGDSLPKQTGTWGNCKAAYRLLNCPAVTRERLMQPHFEETRQAARAAGVMLFVQDTTELDFTSMTAAEGYGPIGNHAGQGLLAHSLLALTPAGQPMGLAAQACWARSGTHVHKGEGRSARQTRKNKESEVWFKVLEAVGPVPDDCHWVSIGDRGSDSFAYWHRARELGWHCLSRIFIDRRTTGSDRSVAQLRQAPAQGTLAVSQRARPGQAARTLQLALAWQPMQIQPPQNNRARAKVPPLEVTLVRCWDARHAVEWLLLATWPVTCFEAAAQCVRWYEQRWTIEEFHKGLKTGCGIEHSQLKQAHAVEALLGFCSVVALRLLALARQARSQPAALAAGYAEPDYLRGLCALRKLNPAQLTLRDYWREIAKIGGFLARKYDGDPGWQTLWKGLRELDTWVEAWRAGFAEGQKCG